jgi:hypothetical protein
MKRAIIVRGNPGVGKTPILIAIYDWIKRTYGPAIIDEEIYTSDVYGILEVGNLRIGLCSAGDDGPSVDDFISKCFRYNCDIIVGACRSRGPTYNLIRARLTYPDFVIEYVIPEWIVSRTSESSRIIIGVDEVKTRLIGLPKI